MSNDFKVVLRKFELEGEEELSEEQLVDILAGRISEMLDTQPDLLFSTLYRLDVFESKINAVLKSDSDTALGLAQLVVDRQKEKLKTKEEYRRKGGSPDFVDV